MHLAARVTTGDGISSAVAGMVTTIADHTDIRLQLITGKSSTESLPEDISTRLGSSALALDVVRLFPGRLGAALSYPPGFARSLVSRADPDTIGHIHGLWRFHSVVGCALLRKLGLPYVISPHGLLTHAALRRRGIRKQLALAFVESRNLRAAATVVCTSEFEAKDVRALGFGEKVAVVPLPVSVDALAYFRSHPRPAPRERRTILCVSRLHSIKRLVELVEAFARVASSFPKWDLVIVGGEDDPGYSGRISAAGREAGLHDRVRLTGVLKGGDLWAAYCAADIFVLPSESENFGLVIAEALAAGVPVIATTSTPWQELRTFRCGWWVGQSVESLASTLAKGLGLSAEARAEMGRRGEVLVAERYSPVSVARQLQTLYESVAVEKKSG